VQLGRVLEYGQLGAGVDQDKAERLYRQAADAGNSQAQYALGLFLIKVRARALLQLAASQGNYDASSCISRIYNYF
jgi:TPR repeat protein